MVNNHWLVVTGTMEFYDFPFSWECHTPNWWTLIFFRGVETGVIHFGWTTKYRSRRTLLFGDAVGWRDSAGEGHRSRGVCLCGCVSVGTTEFSRMIHFRNVSLGRVSPTDSRRFIATKGVIMVHLCSSYLFSLPNFPPNVGCWEQPNSLTGLPRCPLPWLEVIQSDDHAPEHIDQHYTVVPTERMTESLWRFTQRNVGPDFKAVTWMNNG